MKREENNNSNNPAQRIFIASEIFVPNETGGLGLAAYWQCCGLAHTKYKGNVRVLTTNHGIKKGDVIEDKWLAREWGAVKYRSFRRHKLPFNFILDSVREVYRADIVYLVSTFYPPVFICFILAKLFNKGIVWAPHGSVADRELVKNAGFKKVYLSFLRAVVKDVTFHTTCEEETKSVRKHFGSDVKVVTITNYMVLPEKLIRTKEKYLLFIGRFGINKGIENLIRSLAKSVSFLNSEFKLQLIGDYHNSYGSEMVSLSNSLKLGNKVEFLGAMGGEEKQERIAKAYFLFMPSYNENFGIVVAESLVQGTPAVASIYTPWESLVEYEAGFWVDNTPETLGKVIDEIVSIKEDDYNRYCRNALELANRELDIYKNKDKWESLYDSFGGSIRS